MNINNKREHCNIDKLRVAFGQHSAVSWNRTIRRFDDANIYQTWAWGKVQWGLKQMRHIVIYNENHVIAAAQARVLDIPCLKVGIAYIPWGPMMLTSKGPPNLQTRNLIWDAIFNEFTEKRGLILWVQPQTCNTNTTILETSQKQILKFITTPRTRYQTELVNLTQDLDVIRSGLKRNWRNHLVKSEKSNFSVHISTELEDIDVFNRIYKSMKSYKSFHSKVNVSKIRKVQRYLPFDAKSVVFVVYEKNSPISGAICSLTGQTSIYLLGAATMRGREINASYYLHWHIIKWLKNNGVKYYDLGGTDKEQNPGGHSFKKGFGGNEIIFPHWMRSVPTLSTYLYRKDKLT